MAKGNKRYWVYSHDLNGDLVSNIADVDELEKAVFEAADYLSDLVPGGVETLTVRVVDNEAQSGGTTVWIAGPGSRALSHGEALEYEAENNHSVQV